MAAVEKKDKDLWKKFQGYGKIKRHKLAELIINHHLSNSMFGFFMKLLTMAHHKTGALSTCLRELLSVSGCCRKTLQKDMRILVDKGLIKYRPPKARWKENVSYPPGEAPYVLEICGYDEYFEGTTKSTGENVTQVMSGTGVTSTQVDPNTRVNSGQVPLSTGEDFSSGNNLSRSKIKNNSPPNKHNNKHNTNQHHLYKNNTSVISTQVLCGINNDDVFWFQEEFRKRTNPKGLREACNHESRPLLDKDTCTALLKIYGRETISMHLLRLDFSRSNNPPGMFINSLENPEKYGCLKRISAEEKKIEQMKKEEDRRNTEKEKKDYEEKEKREYEKRKETWNAQDNTTRRRYLDRAREEIIEENKGVPPEIMKLCLMDLNVSSRAMSNYFRDRENSVCRI